MRPNSNCKVRFCLLIFAILLQIRAWAQEQDFSEADDPDYAKVYDTFLPVYTQHSGILGLYTNGWGLAYEYGFGKNPKVKHLLSLEFSVLKDPKERTSTVPVIINNRQRIARYIYGKQNIVYPLKLGYGRLHTFSLPNAFRGLGVEWFYKGALIMALTRPYYLTVMKAAEGQSGNENGFKFVDIPYSTKDSLLFLSASNILDYAGFSSGWENLRVNMGLSVGTGIRVDFGSMLKMNGAFGIEIAANADLYFQAIPLLVPLASAPPKNFFLQGRLSFFASAFAKRPSKERRAKPL